MSCAYFRFNAGKTPKRAQAACSSHSPRPPTATGLPSSSLNTGIVLAIACYAIARAIPVRRLAWICGMVLGKSLRLPSLAWGKSIMTMDRDSIAQRASTLQGNGHALGTQTALQIDMNSTWPISRYSTCYRRNIQFCIG